MLTLSFCCNWHCFHASSLCWYQRRIYMFPMSISNPVGLVKFRSSRFFWWRALIENQNNGTTFGRSKFTSASCGNRRTQSLLSWPFQPTEDWGISYSVKFSASRQWPKCGPSKLLPGFINVDCLLISDTLSCLQLSFGFSEFSALEIKVQN